MTGSFVCQNRGEWSEFYAFLKLISTGKLRVLDGEDRTSVDVRVGSVQKGGQSFVLSPPSIFQVLPGGTSTRPRLRPIRAVSGLGESVDQLLSHIRTSRGSFRHPESEELARSLGVSVQSDRTLSKGDLSLSFVRPDSGLQTPKHQVSVKSWLGSDPTLFNASVQGTRLIFQVSGLDDETLLVLAASKDKPKETIKAVLTAGGVLTFVRFARREFSQNLGSLRARDAIAQMVLMHFSKSTRGKTTMNWVLEQKNTNEERRPLRAALREFLRAAALGMTASEEWNLDMTASDNYLIVDADGELLCILGRNKLEEHLFRLAYVDTPSTSRHDYGYPYMANGRWEIALNFQIRIDAK